MRMRDTRSLSIQRRSAGWIYRFCRAIVWQKGRENIMLSRSEIEREVYAVREFLSKTFVTNVSAQEIQTKCKELIDGFGVISQYVKPLKQTEQGIVTMTIPKTASLLADRVWGAETVEDPSIAFGWEFPMEVRLRATLRLFNLFEAVTRAKYVSRPQDAALPHDTHSLLIFVERELADLFHG